MSGIEGNRSQGGLFSQGEALSAAKLNNLAQLAGYGTTKHSSGVQTVQGPFGTVFMDSTTNPDEANFDFPFKVTAGGSQSAGFEVFVRAGTVNNFVPKIDGKYLDATPRPSLKFTSVSGTNRKLVALKITKDGAKFFPNTVEVILRDDEESLTNTDTNGYITIASISFSRTNGVLSINGIFQFIYASQVVARAKPGTATAVWAFSSR
jgi:hypothetical protein